MPLWLILALLRGHRIEMIAATAQLMLGVFSIVQCIVRADWQWGLVAALNVAGAVMQYRDVRRRASAKMTGATRVRGTMPSR